MGTLGLQQEEVLFSKESAFHTENTNFTINVSMTSQYPTCPPTTKSLLTCTPFDKSNSSVFFCYKKQTSHVNLIPSYKLRSKPKNVMCGNLE